MATLSLGAVMEMSASFRRWLAKRLVECAGAGVGFPRVAGELGVGVVEDAAD